MTEQEFNDKWAGVNTDRLPDDQFRQFKQDCFSMYETTGFSDTFHSPYEDTGNNHNGKPFKVLRRANENECDLEAMPIWVIQFEDEDEPCYCYPEEICKIESHQPSATHE